MWKFRCELCIQRKRTISEKKETKYLMYAMHYAATGESLQWRERSNCSLDISAVGNKSSGNSCQFQYSIRESSLFTNTNDFSSFSNNTVVSWLIFLFVFFQFHFGTKHFWQNSLWGSVSCCFISILPIRKSLKRDANRKLNENNAVKSSLFNWFICKMHFALVAFSLLFETKTNCSFMVEIWGCRCGAKSPEKRATGKT